MDRLKRDGHGRTFDGYGRFVRTDMDTPFRESVRMSEAADQIGRGYCQR